MPQTIILVGKVKGQTNEASQEESGQMALQNEVACCFCIIIKVQWNLPLRTPL